MIIIPFGLKINHTVSSPKNEYLYNKKEIVGEELQTTIDMNVATDADVLAHEFGHGISAAADPVGYKDAVQAAPTDYSCQDPTNSFNPISKTALDMQHQYDKNLSNINGWRNFEKNTSSFLR